MPKSPTILHVEILDLAALRVFDHYSLFRDEMHNPDKVIRKAFQELQRRLSAFGLDPDTLLHIGIPEIADRRLISYDCCIEFPLPEENAGVKNLPGGRYAVLAIEKKREKIGPAIRAFTDDYLPEHGFVMDEDRSIYEIYYKDTIEYCMPIR